MHSYALMRYATVDRLRTLKHLWCRVLVTSLALTINQCDAYGVTND